MGRIEERQKGFKAGIDKDGARQKREEAKVSLRKAKKEEGMQKRRNMAAVEEITPDSPQAPAKVTMDELPGLVAGVDGPQPLEALTKLRKLLSLPNNPPIDEVIDAGLVPKFIAFLQHTDKPKLQFEAAWCLTNVASGTSQHCRVVVENGAVPVLVQLLQSEDHDVREQCVWALGNISGDCTHYRDIVLQSGGMMPLLQQIHACLNGQDPTATPSMLQNATWTLSNLCRGKPQPAVDQVSLAMPILAQLITVMDDAVVSDALWALSYISDGPNERIDLLLNAGVVPRLVALMGHQSMNVKTPAVRTIGNVVTGDDSQTQAALDAGCLFPLGALFQVQKTQIRKEAAWTLSNITAGTAQQITAVLQSGVIQAVIHALGNDEFEVKKECAWVLSNVTCGGNDEHIKYIVEQGVLAPMVELLSMNDPKLVSVVMDGIQNILKSGQKIADTTGSNPYAVLLDEAGGVDQIEGLQEHDNNDIYLKAVGILEDYFGEEDDDDENMTPNVQENAQQFTFGVKAQDANAAPFNFGQPAAPVVAWTQ